MMLVKIKARHSNDKHTTATLHLMLDTWMGASKFSYMSINNFEGDIILVAIRYTFSK